MLKGCNDADGPILQRKFSFIEGKPDIADIRPILMDLSESLGHGSSKGEIRCVSSSENTLVDGDPLLYTGNSRNLRANFTEPFWGAEMPERPKQPTSPSLGEVSRVYRCLCWLRIEIMITNAPLPGKIPAHC